MKTVVQVSAVEVIRMVATLVLARPENLGRFAGEVRMCSDPGGITEVQVVTFDTAEEAKEHVASIGGVPAAEPKAQVLHLVHTAPFAKRIAPCESCPGTLGCINECAHDARLAAALKKREEASDPP